MPHLLTTVALAVHIGAGIVGLVSGTIASVARKGGRAHRAAGHVFFAAMAVMAAFAACLAVVVPGQLVNLFISAFTFYLVATGWLTGRGGESRAGVAHRLSLAVAVLLCAPFALLSLQLATGMAPLFRSAVPFKGPVLIAIYVFTSVLIIAVAGDARMVFAGGLSGAPRIARHLWRMCLGLALAAGSAFTNGAARLLPGPYQVPPAFFLPQFLPVALLTYWMIRVRLAPGRSRRGADPGDSATTSSWLADATVTSATTRGHS